MGILKNPSHPGRVLKNLYLTPLGMSEGKLAKHIDVPRTRIERLVKGETGVTVDTALRLSKAFGTTPDYWLNMQTNYEIANAKDVSVERLEFA